MEDRLGSLINQFEIAIEQIKKQNQSNLDMLDDFIDIYDQAFKEIKKLRLKDIFYCRKHHIITAVLDVLMIIVQNPMNEVVHEFGEYPQREDGVYQMIYVDFIKPTCFDITKSVLRRKHFLDSLIYIDPRKINEEVIELFDANLMCLKDTFLKIENVNRLQEETSIFCFWMLNIVEFCREYNKRNIKVLNYPKIRNIILQIEEFLQTEQKQLCQEQTKEKSEMEQDIFMIFECFKKQKSITEIQTDCLLKLRNKFDIKDWIQNQRPLYYWTTLDDEPAGIMFKWIAELQKNSSLLEILKTENIGFDFLLLLNQSELDQIYMLNLNLDSYEFNQFILDNLENVKLKNIQKLELNYRILQTASDNEENKRSLCQFLNQQQNITSLCLEESGEQFTMGQILQSFPCIENFKYLSIKIQFQMVNYTELINEINKYYNLSKLTLNFKTCSYIYKKYTFIEFSQGLNNLKNLIVFKIQITIKLIGITANITRFIEQQQNLLEFEYINNIPQEQTDDDEAYKQLQKILKTKKVRSQKFDLFNKVIKQSLRKSLLKLKYSVIVKC